MNAPKNNKSAVGDDVILTSTFTDIGVLDRHAIEIDWDDGLANSEFDVDPTATLAVGDTFTSADGTVLIVTSVDLSTGEVGFGVAAHQYQTGGIFEVIITIRDDDSGSGSSADSASATTQAWVSGLRLINNVLYVIGTSDADHVTINKQGNGLLKVHADFLVSGNFETFPLPDVHKIIAYLCEGDDHMNIAGNIDIPSIIHAGPDDDHINGGGGPSVILGESGDDHLNGMGDRDILIGGTGEDRLVGGQGDDVLIGGTTNFDNDDDALMTVLAAWASSASYTDRVAAIDIALLVIDDNEDDRTTGSSDQDLFYDGLGDDLTDVSTKNNNVETVL